MKSPNLISHYSINPTSLNIPKKKTSTAAPNKNVPIDCVFHPRTLHPLYDKKRSPAKIRDNKECCLMCWANTHETTRPIVNKPIATRKKATVGKA